MIGRAVTERAGYSSGLSTFGSASTGSVARHGQPRWDGRCYCRTRRGLMRRVRELAGECDAIALATLEYLPEWVGVGEPDAEGA